MPNLVVGELTSQLEDYLETIAHLQDENLVARAKDIAERMGVTRATVTSALKNLGEKGLINYEPYSFVTLTKAGLKVAEDIIRRHEILTEFFRDVLHMEHTQADANACRAEHTLDADAIERMVSFLSFLKTCPRTEDWLDSFDKYCKREGAGKGDCRACIEECLKKLD